MSRENQDNEDSDLQEGVDYYVEGGLLVFTASFLLKRGYCCDSGCRHCPYPKDDDKDRIDFRHQA